MKFIALSTITIVFCASAIAAGTEVSAARPQSVGDLIPRSGAGRVQTSGVVAELYVAPDLQSTEAPASLKSIFPDEALAGCEQFCAPIISPDPLSIANLSIDLSQFYAPEISFGEACNCLERTLEKDGPSVSNQELERQRRLLGERARSEFKNFVLDTFASHVEDVSFYIHNQSGSFRSLNESAEREAQCLSPQSIESFIKGRNYCGRRLNRAQKQRIKDIFAEYSDSSELSDNLRAFNTEIMNSNVMKNGKMYTRRDFDVQRQSLIRISSEFHNSTTFLQNILKDSASSAEVLRVASDRGIAPYHAISEYLLKLLNERNYTKLSSLIPPEILNNAKSQGVIRENLLRDELVKVYSELLNHPTTKRILTDKSLYHSSIDHLQNNTLESLLAGPDFIKEYFEAKCERIKHNFANYICVDDEDFSSRIQSENFKTFVSLNLESSNSEEDKRANQIRTLLACRHQNESGSISVEERIQLFDNALMPSDLFARKKNQETNFIRFANVSNDSEAGQFLSDATDDYVRSFPEISPERFRSRVNTSLAATTEEPPADRQDRIDRNEQSQTSFIDNGSQYQTVSAEAPIAQSADAATAANRNNSNNSADQRRELTDFLSNMENREEVERLMNGTSNEMMQELLKLREEMDKNQQRLNELLAENQRLKTEEMRRKLENLEDERAALDPGPVRSRTEASRSRDLPSAVPGTINRVSNVAPVETGGSNAGSSSHAASTGSEGAALSDLNRALLASGAGAGRGPASESDAPIVVSASGARSGSIEIRSQEVGLDLLNYLSNNGSDIQTLINLKTSGILYRYQVLENGLMVQKEVLIEYNNLNEDVKKIIDEKIAQNSERNNEVIRLDREIQELRRVYSYSALQMIMAEQMRNKSE